MPAPRKIVDQLITEIESLEAENKRMKAALDRLALRGIHADCTPTIAANSQDFDLIAFFYNYLSSANDTVMSIALGGLETSESN